MPVIWMIVFFGAAVIAAAQPKTIGTAELDRVPVTSAADVSAASSLETLQIEGTRVAVLKIANGSAPAARLLIRDMTLPAGARLYLYGRSADGQVHGPVFGPFTGTGPLATGEFWTHPIEGAEIVLEVQSDSGLTVAAPLRIAAVAPTSDTFTDAEQTDSRSESGVRTSVYRGIPLTHSVESGWAIFEGDIILGRADDLPAVSGKASGSDRRDGVAITGSQYRWPGGVVPYTIDPSVPNQARITDAIAHWNSSMAGHVSIVPRTTESAYVTFVRAPSASTCSSNVGRLGYQQSVNVGDYCATGNLIHEIGHAIGLWHEQSREDRDTYVKINWANVQAGMEHNFYQQIANGDDVGGYNYGSVMHYSATAFSANGLPTIETLPSGIYIGQRSGLNAGDIAALKLMYPATSPAPSPTPSNVAVTVASNPGGMVVALDGASTLAPAVASWLSGSVHTVAALNPAAANGVRYTFARWSDGGAATHQITVPTAPTTLRADYTTAYLLQSTAPVGSVSRTPASADGYYASGSTVQVAATAPAGYCFAGWTGLPVGTPGIVNLTMNAPYTIQANFQTGTVSASPSAVAAGRDGGTYQISVSANAGCQWSAASNANWVRIVSGGSGSGPGVLTIALEAKKGGNKRTAQITLPGVTVTIQQQ